MATPTNPEKGYERFFNAFFDRNFKKVSKALQGAGGFISDTFLPGSSGYFKALKTVEVVVDQIVEIQNVHKAFYYALVYSAANTFFKGMVVYKLELQDDDLSIRQYRKSILDSFDEKHYQATSFDVARFNADPTVAKIRTRFLEWAKVNEVSGLNLQRLEKYFNRYQEVDFFEVLESSKTKYARLTEFLNNASYQKRIKLLRRVDYENELAEQYRENVLGDEHGVTLDEIYIEPKFKIHHRSVTEDILKDKKVDVGQSGFFEPTLELNIHQYVNQLLLHQDPLELEKQHTRALFLLGYPGQGKTSFCKRLIYDIVQEQNPPIHQAFYFVKLKNISDTATNDLLRYPIDTVRKEVELQIKEELDKFKFYESLLILDGLDELKMNKGLTDGDIDDFCARLINETEKHLKLRVILTSRYGYIKLDHLPKSCHHALILQLENFDLTQQKQWLTKYRQFNQTTPLTEAILEEFNDEDDTYDAIRELLGQPILLKIVATLEQPLDKKDTKTKIYEKLFDQLIQRRYAGGKQIKALEGVSEEDLRRIIQDIALEIFQSPYEYVHYQQLKEMAAEWGLENFKESVKNLMISFYFKEIPKSEEDNHLQNKDNYAIEFLHKSLQEYMTAEKIWREVQELSNKKDSFFKEVFELFAPKLLSLEVAQDLTDIIQQADETLKQAVAKKFQKFFPELLKHDFLYKYEYYPSPTIMASPTEQSRHVFYGFWTILIHAQPETNFLTDVTRAKFTTLLSYYGDGLPLLNLSFQNLDWMKLPQADLSGADLSGANLMITNLVGANLMIANLVGVNLMIANLVGANLMSANLRHALLSSPRYFERAIIHASTKIDQTYVLVANWLNELEQVVQNDSDYPLEFHKYYIAGPLSAEEIENSPNLYLKEVAKGGQSIYQIRLKPGETEED